MAVTPLLTAAEMTAAVASFGSLASGTQTALIAAATEAINRATDRFLGSDSYSETYNPDRTRVIDLKQYPVTAIARLTTDLFPVLTIQNTSTSNQRATVNFTTGGSEDAPTFTGLTLIRVSSGVATTSSLLFSTYTTLGSLSTAINAIGNGWTASVVTPATGSPTAVDYNLWACSDLNTEIGSMDAFSAPCNLYAYVRDLPFKLVPNGRATRRVQLFEGRPNSFRYPDRTAGYGYGLLGGGFGYDTDYGTVRVTYTAGYSTATVPSDIKQQAILAIEYYRARQTAPGVFASKTVGKVSYSVGTLAHMTLPADIIAALQPHRRCEIV